MPIEVNKDDPEDPPSIWEYIVMNDIIRSVLEKMERAGMLEKGETSSHEEGATGPETAGDQIAAPR